MSEQNYSKKGILLFIFGYFTGVLSCILILLAVFFLAGYPLKYYLAKKGVSSLKAPDLSASFEFDYKIEVKELKEDKTHNLENLKGEPFFAVFWHPDCIHCLSTILTVNGLISKLGDRMPVISFTSASPESVSQTLHYLSCDIPVYIISSEKFESFTGGNVPQGMVVDSAGKIVYKYVGSANWDDSNVVDVLLTVQ